MSAEDYLRLKGKYLLEGEQLLAKGDHAQASEKFWGAAAEMVKAIAAREGVTPGAHRSLVRYVIRLDMEHPEWRLQEAFAMAETLHTNFYEDNLPEEAVKIRTEAVKSFIEKLRTLP